MTPRYRSWCLWLVLPVAGIIAPVFLILGITVFGANLGVRAAPWGWGLLRYRHGKCWRREGDMEVCRVPLPCTLSGKRTNAVQYTKTGEVYRVDCRKPMHRDRRLAGMLEMAPPLTDTAILGLPGGSWTALPATGPTWAVFSKQTGPRLPHLSRGRHRASGGWVHAERTPTATAIAMSHGSQPVHNPARVLSDD
jgi:hypothetical protein